MGLADTYEVWVSGRGYMRRGRGSLGKLWDGEYFEANVRRKGDKIFWKVWWLKMIIILLELELNMHPYIHTDRKEFLLAWKDIPQNFEFQSNLTTDFVLTTDQVETALNANNISTIARRNVAVGGGVSQDLMYMSARFINNIWLLAELKITTGSTTISVCEGRV